MKRHLFGLLSVTGLAVLAGCFSTTDTSEGGPEASGNAISAGDLDDAFATSILAGGCAIEVEGSAGKTKGLGGTCPTKLSAILDAIEAQPDRPQVFVVSEKADRPDDTDATFRFVVSSKSGGLPFYIAHVSVGGNISEDGVEAIGFSPTLQAFAYYKVEGGRWVRHGDATQVKSTTKGTDKPFECISCHTTGAPLMKELHDSWGNWTSTWDAVRGPKTQNASFKRLFGKVERADLLENIIIDGIKKHSKGRVDRAKKEGKLKGVLTQLMCEVGEPSIIGAHNKNSSRMSNVSTISTMLPGAIMLNQLFVPPRTGATGTELGLEQSLKLNVPSAGRLKVDATAYASAVLSNGQTIGGQPGDTIFPMSSPEKSHADLDAVQELLRQNLIDNEVVADALMTDYTVSAFSKFRCALADTIPDTWDSPAALKRAWAANLASSPLRGAKGLKVRLEKDDLTAHEQKLEAFANKCAERPAAEFTPDVLKIMSQRRVEFENRYSNVVESDWLIPQDNLRSTPGDIRFSKVCTIEKASNPFDGED